MGYKTPPKRAKKLWGYSKKLKLKMALKFLPQPHFTNFFDFFRHNYNWKMFAHNPTIFPQNINFLAILLQFLSNNVDFHDFSLAPNCSQNSKLFLTFSFSNRKISMTKVCMRLWTTNSGYYNRAIEKSLWKLCMGPA